MSLLSAVLLTSGLLILPTPSTNPALAAPGSVEVLADTDNNSSTPAVREFAGATRYETSLATAQRYINTARASGNSASTVIVASGESLIDAAAAAGLARATNAPVLLTPTSTVFEPAAHLIEREGISRVIIVGGPSAVSPQVEATFNGVPGVQTVERIGGANRFHTAALIAGAMRPTASYCGSGSPAALLVTGDSASLADVTIAGPVSYAYGIPVLLVSVNGVPAETATAIRQHGIKRVVVLGATQITEGELRASGATSITRLAGPNSFATSVVTLEALQNCLGGTFDSQSVALISNTALPDGISAAPMLGQGLRQPGQVTPVLLVGSNALPTEVGDYLRRTPSAIQITAIGGVAAISAEVAAAAVTSANGSTPTAALADNPSPGNTEVCRLIGNNSPDHSVDGHVHNITTTGFPLPVWAAPTTDELRVAMLFVDFPNAPARYTTQQEAAGQIQEFERYIERVSYGKLDLQVDPLHTWLRMPRDYLFYSDRLDSGITVVLPDELADDAVAIADPFFDFALEYDVVMFVLPSQYFGGGVAQTLPSGVFADDQHLFRFSVINSTRHFNSETGPSGNWWFTAAHELGHNLGLLDLYPYQQSISDPPATRIPGSTWVQVEMGLMGLRGYLSVPNSDARFHRQAELPAGWTYRANDRSTIAGVTTHLRAPEMLGWTRWQLGWLDNEQVHCLSDPSTYGSITLSPIAAPSGTAMIVLPVSETSALVIEARRKLGFDATSIRHESCCEGRFETITTPRLAEEGLVVYSVDSVGVSGELPVSFWYGSPSETLRLREYPLLTTGNLVSATFEDGAVLRISVESDDGHSFNVRVTVT